MKIEDSSLTSTPILTSYIAVPQDHGSWVFILSPLLIGYFCSGEFTHASLLLGIAALSVFFLRQPAIIAVKCYSGRRAKKDLRAAWFWILVYGFISAAAFLGLILQGFGYLAYLAAVGIPVFIWYLYLVSIRSERKQIGVQVVGSGVLALAAPAAYWIGHGFPDPIGWLLFILVWLQSAASIVHAYMRLQQRTMKSMPDRTILLQIGKRAISYTTFNLVLVVVLSVLKITPLWLFLAYILQWTETIIGVFHPAINVKPTSIGIRQLIVSMLFTGLFIFFWPA